MRVTINVRPWIQNRSTGTVVLNTRASLSPYVRASPQTFTLPPGERRVSFNMRRMTASGSLYAGFQVFAKQAKPTRAQRHHPAVGPAREDAPEPVAQEPEPAHRRHATSSAGATTAR